MKTGTKIGWALVALAIFISVWVLTGGIGKANTTETDVYGNTYEIDDSGTVVSFTFASGTVVVPASANIIGDGVFQGQTQITDVDASRITNIGSNAFAGCTSLATVNIANASNIGGSAFESCTALSSVTLSGNLTNIGDNAFKNCVNLVGVTIPANVRHISSGAFNGCSKLASINVDPSNPYYSSDGIALYSISDTTLAIVPPAAGAGDSTFRVNNGCTNIAEYAFTGNSNIKVLHLPASVTTWGNQHGFTPDYIYIADDFIESLRDALKAEYAGTPTRIVTESGGSTPPSTPTGTYKITGSNLLANGNIEIYFTTPTGTEIPDAGSVDGDPLNTSMGTIDATKLTLYKSYLDTIRPPSGSLKISVTLACGENNFDPGRDQNPYYFELAANPGPAPVPTYSLNPTSQEMYNNDGNFLIDVYNAAPGVISAVTVQNQGDYNLITNGYCSIAANGSGSRLTISSNYISSLTPGGTYVIKVSFNDGAAALTSKLYILTPGNPNPKPSRPSSSTSSGSGSSIVSGSGTSYTQPASSTLYGNGYTSTTTASSATGTTHTKDTTPSTADGWDARLAFAIALLLAGVVVLMLSRRNAAKLEMIRKDRE